MSTRFDRWFVMGATMVFVLILASGGLWHARERRAESSCALEALHREAAALRHQLEESDALPRVQLQDENVAVRSHIDRYRTELALAPVKDESVDPIFAVARFVEEARSALGRASIEVRANEQFGFGAEAGVAETGGRFTARLEQIAAHRLVIEALCASGPARLLSLESATTEISPNRAPARSSGLQVSTTDASGLPAMISSSACRIEFSASSTTLRSFLLALSHAPGGIVRNVEIEGGSMRTHAGVPSAAKPTGASTAWLARIAVVVDVVRSRAGKEDRP